MYLGILVFQRLLNVMAANIDHLVYASPSLEEGMAAIEHLIGVRPVYGGQHPQWGTHNALLGLGPRAYLEVIAPDPTLIEPGGGRLFARSFAGAPRLITWAAACADIDHVADTCRAAGLDLGAITTGQRTTADRGILSWRLSDIYRMPLQGMFPFLIDWGASPHPARSLPSGGHLVDLTITHPEAAEVRRFLHLLGMDCVVHSGPAALMATIRTVQGEVQLR